LTIKLSPAFMPYTPFLQLNGKINKQYQIETLGLKTLNPVKKQNFTSPVQIDSNGWSESFGTKCLFIFGLLESISDE